jgi:hypothetical protein
VRRRRDPPGRARLCAVRRGNLGPGRIDTGADRTTFIWPVQLELNLPAVGSRDRLTGIGGSASAFQVATYIRFFDEDSQPLRFEGQYSVLTDPKAMDMSLLGATSSINSRW